MPREKLLEAGPRLSHSRLGDERRCEGVDDRFDDLVLDFDRLNPPSTYKSNVTPEIDRVSHFYDELSLS